LRKKTAKIQMRRLFLDRMAGELKGQGNLRITRGGENRKNEVRDNNGVQLKRGVKVLNKVVNSCPSCHNSILGRLYHYRFCHFPGY